MTFQEILDNHGVSYLTEGHHHCRPGWVQFDCPFCGRGSNAYHMGYSLEGNYVSCWRCRGHGLVATVMELCDIDYRSAKSLLGGISEGFPAARKIERRGTLVMPKGLGPLLAPHCKYLRDERSLDPAILAKFWRLQGLNAIGRVKPPDRGLIALAWRIFIPYIEQGEVVSWTTRTISPMVTQRYIAAPANCEAVDHKTLLFGEHLTSRHAVVAVEGEFDAMKVGPGCVAVGGTAFKMAQVNRLSRYLKRTVCFDSENDAQKRAVELVDLLSAFPGETINVCLDAKDPGAASDKELQQLRRVAGI